MQAVVDQFDPKRTEVLVVYVIEGPKGLPPSMAFAPAPTGADHVVSGFEETRRRGTEVIGRARHRLEAAHFGVRGELREGDARHTILDCASEWDPHVIVVGSHGRRGLDRFFLGSVSEDMVRRAPCSVQVVRHR